MGKQARGYKQKVVAIEQTTIDEVPDPANGHQLYFRSFGVRDQQDLEESESMTGDRGRPEPDLGNINVSGPMTTESDASNLGLLFKHLFGAVATTGAGPYTHDFTVAEPPGYLLLEVDRTDAITGNGQFQRFLGCRVASAEFSMPRSGYPTINWDFLGADSSLAAAALDADPTVTEFTPFTAFRATLEEGGAATAQVTEARVTLSNDLDDDQYVVGGAGKRVDIPEGHFLISGQITSRFTSAELMEKAINGTKTSLVYTLKRGTGDGSAGNELIKITLPNIRLQRNSPSIDGPSGLVVQMDLQGFLDAGQLASAQLKNQVASY